MHLNDSKEAKPCSSERADERRSLFKGAGAELIKISNCARCGENCSARLLDDEKNAVCGSSAKKQYHDIKI
jgi:hypothetical protein